MKNLILVFSIFLCLSAHAQTDSTVRAKIRTSIPDNMSRSITPLLMRSTLNTMMDYILKYTQHMTIGASGSFSIKPKGIGTGLGTPPPPVAKDLFVAFTAHKEDSLKTLDLYGRMVNVKYSGKQLFTQRFILNAPNTETQVIGGIDNLIELETSASYINSASHERTFTRNDIAKFNSDAHTVTVNNYDCTGCTQKKIFLTITYSKQ